jgi:hypothetical protein
MMGISSGYLRMMSLAGDISHTGPDVPRPTAGPSAG